MEAERDEAVEPGVGVAVADSDDERSFLRSTNTLRCEKMDDNFFAPPRRTLSRSTPSSNSGRAAGDAAAAVMRKREGGETRGRGEGGARSRELSAESR